MNVTVYPSDGTGCGTYRMFWPGEAVKNSGKPVTIMPRPPQVLADNLGNAKGINVGNSDVVVFQRPGSIHFSQLIPILHEHGKKVVFDMDDSLSKILPRNPAFRTYDPRISPRTNWMHAAKACEMADLVTVTTPALAEEYGSHGRCVVIPNHIPASYLSIPRPQNEVPVVGWAGWTNTHVGDLYVTRGMINQAIFETGAKFVAFGDLNIFNELGIKPRAPHENWSFTSIPEYPKRLVGFDIGLVPLQPNPFNECKSWLKALEYASLGIVPVVSPTPDNLRLVELGAAIRADSPVDWHREVKELILDNEKRSEMSKRCREVAADWTIEGNAHKWWNAWSSVNALV